MKRLARERRPHLRQRPISREEPCVLVRYSFDLHVAGAAGARRRDYPASAHGLHAIPGLPVNRQWQLSSSVRTEPRTLLETRPNRRESRDHPRTSALALRHNLSRQNPAAGVPNIVRP
jgi:hypothetical protein